MIFDVLYCIALVKLRLATNTIFLLLALLVLDIAVFMGSRYSDPAVPSTYYHSPCLTTERSEPEL